MHDRYYIDEPTLDSLLEDPVVQTVMASDRVRAADVRTMMRRKAEAIRRGATRARHNAAA